MKIGRLEDFVLKHLSGFGFLLRKIVPWRLIVNIKSIVSRVILVV